MNVIVVDHEELAGRLDAGGTRVEHLAGPDHVVARVAADPASVVLILARAPARPCFERQLREGVAAAGSAAPVLFLRDGAPAAQATGPPPMCAIEEGADGTRLLRCALQQARAEPEREPALAEAIGDRSLVFAYSAPVRRNG